MPKKTQDKIGFVKVQMDVKGRWHASWWDAVTRKHIRRLLPAVDYEELVKQVKPINQAIAEGKGFETKMRGATGQGIREACDEAIRASGANSETMGGYGKNLNPFLQWLEETRKGVQLWSELTPKIILDYVQALEKKGLAYDTMRQRLFIIRRTSRYMAETYPHQYWDVAAKIKLRRQRRELLEAEAQARPRDILTAEELMLLLEFFREHRPDLYPIICLTGLCGLRIREAAYLREQDIDLKARTIRIASTSKHVVKNDYSARTIPVCDRVIQVLAETIRSLTVRTQEGYIFRPKGRSTPWSFDGLPYALAAVVNAFWQEHSKTEEDKKRFAVFESFMTRHLRATWATLVREQRADSRLVQAYLGQTPTDILGRHYERINIERLRSEIIPCVNNLQNEKSGTTYIRLTSAS